MRGFFGPNRIAKSLWAGVGLSGLLLLQSLTAQASVCGAAPTPTTLAKEYDRTQILAIGVNDHTHFQPFEHLAELIKTRGLDKQLKTIVIEDSIERAALYAELSVSEMTFAEFKKRATAVYGMFTAHEDSLFKTVLPAVRAINLQRPQDPLIVTSVDGMNNAHALEALSKPPNEVYATSIAREKETAANYLRTVARGRKTIVAYQATHVVKNMSAKGIVSEGDTRANLSWLSFATGDSARVILIDSLGAWSPNGVLNTPPGISRPTRTAVAFDWAGCSLSDFKTGTFLRNYRSGTIDVIDATKPVFDAVILEP